MGLGIDIIHKVDECTKSGDTTESSSSFDDCDFESDDPIEDFDFDFSEDDSIEDNSDDDASLQRTYNKVFDMFRQSNKTTTTHWRSFIHPLMWRCKWLELQISKCEELAAQCDKSIKKLYREKQVQATAEGAKSLPAFQSCDKRRVFKRKKRRRDELVRDIEGYMKRHNIFSFWIERDMKKSSTKGANSATHEVDNDDELRDSTGMLSDENHLENMYRKIEGAQSHVHKLKSRVANLPIAAEASSSNLPMPVPSGSDEVVLVEDHRVAEHMNLQPNQRLNGAPVAPTPDPRTNGPVTADPDPPTNGPVTADPDPPTNGPVAPDTDPPTNGPVTVDPDPPTNGAVTVDPDPPTNGPVTVAPDPPTNGPVAPAPDLRTNGPVSADPDPPANGPVAPDHDPPTNGPVTVDPDPPTNGPVTVDPDLPTNGPVTVDPDPPTNGPVTVDPDPPTNGPVAPAPDPRTNGPVSAAPDPRTNGPVSADRDPPTNGPVSAAPDPRTNGPVAPAPDPPTNGPVAPAPDPPTNGPVAADPDPPTNGQLRKRTQFDSKVTLTYSRRTRRGGGASS